MEASVLIWCRGLGGGDERGRGGTDNAKTVAVLTFYPNFDFYGLSVGCGRNSFQTHRLLRLDGEFLPQLSE